MDVDYFFPVACIYLLCRGVGCHLAFRCRVIFFSMWIFFGCDPKCELRDYYKCVSDTSFINWTQVSKVRQILQDGHTPLLVQPGYKFPVRKWIGRVQMHDIQ